MKSDLIDKIVNGTLDRRGFVKRAGMTGLGAAATAMLGSSLLRAQTSSSSSSTPTTSYTDTDILNFALNLEYLEAEFYLMATWGTTLVKLGVLTEDDTTGPTTGGNMVNFSGANIAFLASALRSDEIAHVEYLRAALGSAAAKKPSINLAALGYGFSSVDDFMKLSRQFEDVGVSAYLGAAPLVSETYLPAAAAIMATEAQHSGSMRLSCIWYGVNSPAVDSLDVPPTESTPYDVDKNALSIPRTFDQVLAIVYAGGNCSGGFYPSGMNGTITCGG